MGRKKTKTKKRKGWNSVTLKRNRVPIHLEEETTKTSRHQEEAAKGDDIASIEEDIEKKKEARHQNSWGQLSHRLLKAIRREIPKEDPPNGRWMGGRLLRGQNCMI